MGFIAPVIAGIGVFTSAIAAKNAATAENDALEYNARVNENNAQLADIQSQQATAKGALEEKQHRLRLSQMKGSQRAGFASGGVLVDEGSSMDVLEDTTHYGELDALEIRYNAANQAWGHDSQAQNFRSQAGMNRSSKRSPGMAFTSSLLGSAGTLARSFM